MIIKKFAKLSNSLISPPREYYQIYDILSSITPHSLFQLHSTPLPLPINVQVIHWWLLTHYSSQTNVRITWCWDAHFSMYHPYALLTLHRSLAFLNIFIASLSVLCKAQMNILEKCIAHLEFCFSKPSESFNLYDGYLALYVHYMAIIITILWSPELLIW